MTIVGYTHSGGYALCPRHASEGALEDENNETGYVYPVFATDEGAEELVCDVCLERLVEGDEEDTSGASV